MKKPDGWWSMFFAPELNDDGNWSISEKDSRDGSIKLHEYESEEDAQAAYQGMLTASMSRVH